LTGIQSLEARAALGCIFAAAGYVAASSPGIQRESRERFDRAVNAAFIVSRVAVYLAAFFVLRLPVRGDIAAYYFPEAHLLMRHELPYRDFASSYGPLHTYLDAAVLLVWNSPLAIILFAILVECLILPVWMRVARLFAPESAVRIAAVLYVASAISLQFVTIDGQDNVVIALLLGLGILAIARERDALSGVLVGFSAVLVKFLSLLFAPAFVLASRRWLLWLLGFAAVLVVGYGAFALQHLPILYPLSAEGSLRTASDLPYVVESIAGFTPPMVFEDGLLALALLAVTGLMLQARMRRLDAAARVRLAVFGCASLNMALLIFSKKSWPPYLVLTLFPLGLLMGRTSWRRARLACFALFNVVAVTSHSIWATVFRQFLAGPLHEALGRGEPMAWFFWATQILLVAGYAWLLVESLQAIRRPDAALFTRASAES
jgi:hypothetical protein